MADEVASYLKELTSWYHDRVHEALGTGQVSAMSDPGSSPPPPPPRPKLP